MKPDWVDQAHPTSKAPHRITVYGGEDIRRFYYSEPSKRRSLPGLSPATRVLIAVIAFVVVVEIVARVLR